MSQPFTSSIAPMQGECTPGMVIHQKAADKQGEKERVKLLKENCEREKAALKEQRRLEHERHKESLNALKEHEKALERDYEERKKLGDLYVVQGAQPVLTQITTVLPETQTPAAAESIMGASALATQKCVQTVPMETTPSLSAPVAAAPIAACSTHPGINNCGCNPSVGSYNGASGVEFGQKPAFGTYGYGAAGTSGALANSGEPARTIDGNNFGNRHMP